MKTMSVTLQRTRVETFQCEVEVVASYEDQEGEDAEKAARQAAADRPGEWELDSEEIELSECLDLSEDE